MIHLLLMQQTSAPIAPLIKSDWSTVTEYETSLALKNRAAISLTDLNQKLDRVFAENEKSVSMLSPPTSLRSVLDQAIKESDNYKTTLLTLNRSPTNLQLTAGFRALTLDA